MPLPRRLLPALMLALSLLWPAPPAAADDNAEANRLFVEAMTLWTEANAPTPDSLATLERRAEALDRVVTLLERIVTDHSGADLAVRLTIGEDVGTLSLPAARALRDNTRAKLEASQPLLACRTAPSHTCVAEIAKQAISSVGNQTFQETAIQLLAVAQARAGRVSEAAEVASGIEDAARRAEVTRLIQDLQDDADKFDAIFNESRGFAQVLSKESSWEEWPLGEIASSLARERPVEFAISAALSKSPMVISEDIIDFDIILEMVEARKQGRFLEAREILRRIEAKPFACDADDGTLTRLAEDAARIVWGRDPSVEVLLEQYAIVHADRLVCHQQAGYLSAIARDQARAGQVPEALNWALEIDLGNYERAVTLAAILAEMPE